MIISDIIVEHAQKCVTIFRTGFFPDQGGDRSLLQVCFDWKHLYTRRLINRGGNLVTQSVFNLNAMRTEMFAPSSQIVIYGLYHLLC